MNINNITFTMAQYKYKCFMYDVFNMSNVEYPCKGNSFIEGNNWILKDHNNNPLAIVTAKGKVQVM